MHKSSPTPSIFDPPCSNNEPPPLQNLNPKEYTYKEHTAKEDTVKEQERKKRVEEAGASSPLTPAGDNKVTLLEAAEYVDKLSAEEKRRFDNKARKLGKPGEPEPDESLWQKRRLRVRYLERLRAGESEWEYSE